MFVATAESLEDKKYVGHYHRTCT